jgi:DNA replication protein DnaC
VAIRRHANQTANWAAGGWEHQRAKAVLQGYRVGYREAHILFEELAEAALAGTLKDYLAELAVVPPLIIDDGGMRKLAHAAAEDLLELIMRRYERPPRCSRRTDRSMIEESS